MMKIVRHLPVFLLLAGACTPPAPTSAPVPAAVQPRTLAAADSAIAMRLLAMEDRRVYDAGLAESAAASASPEVRRRAALAAGRIRDARSIPLLGRLLGDADSAVAATAAFALGLVGDTSAVALLAPLLDPARVATAPTVVGEAAYALGKLRSAASRSALEGFLRAAPQSGAGVREAVGPALLAIWRFPRPADPRSPILPWLASTDSALRWRAAYALSRRPDPTGTRALSAHVDDSEAIVRAWSVRAMTAPLADSAGLGHDRTLHAVLLATEDSSHAVSVNAVRTLGTYAEPVVVDHLIRLLRADDAYLAITAAESLGRLGARATASAAALRAVAEDAGRPVFLRTTALASLAEVSAADARAVADAFAREAGWRPRAAAGRAYVRLGDRERVEELARDPDGRVASQTLEAAVAAAGDSAVGRIRNLLVESLGHADVIVRTNALTGLAALADPATLPVLMDAYERARGDTLNDAALAALDALGALAKQDAAAAHAFFTRFPRSGDYLVRLRARQAFGDSLAVAWGEPLPVETMRDRVSVILPENLPPARPRARIVTDRGEIELELFGDDAPLTVRSFLGLAREGYFDGQEWPRVVPNFVVQGGDPRGDTSGGPGYAIRDEINRHPYGAGTLGMALSGPDTGGSQWFITHSPQPHLDGIYTVFGRVTQGMDVIHRILPGDRILRIEEVR